MDYTNLPFKKRFLNPSAPTMNKEKTPYKILQILKDGQFHSGEDLGQTLDITRSAIWKAVKQLTSHYHMDIQSISGKGYRIEGGIDLLDLEKIRHALTPELHDDLQISILDQIDSTNNYLLEHIRSDTPCGLPYHVVIAEQQTEGRGRHGSEWTSPYGHNVYFSLAWCCGKDSSELSGLSLAAGIAIIRTLKRFGIQDLTVKWPNDIYYHDKKLAGVLIDLVGESHDRTTMIIGIGINTYLSNKSGSAISQPWVSLYDILGTLVDRNQLIATLSEEVINMIHQFDNSGLQPFIDEWNAHDGFRGQRVVLFNSAQKYNGIMQGIGKHGELILQGENGKIMKFFSGELSLRKAPC